MADKKLSDYLHHYIGGVCLEVNTGEEFTITPEIYCKIISGELNAKPVLFPNVTALPDDKYKEYSDLIEAEEEKHFHSMKFWENAPKNFIPLQAFIFNFLTKNNVDLFYLVDAGLAIPDDTHLLRSLEIATELYKARRNQVA